MYTVRDIIQCSVTEGDRQWCYGIPYTDQLYTTNSILILSILDRVYTGKGSKLVKVDTGHSQYWIYSRFERTLYYYLPHTKNIYTGLTLYCDKLTLSQCLYYTDSILPTLNTSTVYILGFFEPAQQD